MDSRKFGVERKWLSVLVIYWRDEGCLWSSKRGYTNSRERGARGTSWDALASD